MKKILATSDFSDNAQPAARYAAHLCHATSAQLDLLHVHQITMATGLYGQGSDFIQRQIRSDMANLIRTLQQEIGTDLPIHPRILSGGTVEAIAELSPEYDLIAMGTRGQNGIERWLLGSTTIGVIDLVAQPVLAIPPRFTYRPPQRLVLALDDGGIDQEGMIHPMLEVARHYQSHVFVVHHGQGQEGNDNMDVDLDIYLEGLEYSLHYDMSEDSAWESVCAFAEDERADMIVMIRRQRRGLDRWFGSRATSQSVHRTTLPLLILQEKSTPKAD